MLEVFNGSFRGVNMLLYVVLIGCFLPREGVCNLIGYVVKL